VLYYLEMKRRDWDRIKVTVSRMEFAHIGRTHGKEGGVIEGRNIQRPPYPQFRGLAAERRETWEQGWPQNRFRNMYLDEFSIREIRRERTKRSKGTEHREADLDGTAQKCRRYEEKDRGECLFGQKPNNKKMQKKKIGGKGVLQKVDRFFSFQEERRA